MVIVRFLINRVSYSVSLMWIYFILTSFFMLCACEQEKMTLMKLIDERKYPFMVLFLRIQTLAWFLRRYGEVKKEMIFSFF